MTGLTQWALRERAGAAGYPVSGKQFGEYVRWGLLSVQVEPDRWPEDAVDQLIRIRELSEGVRSMPRRVIQLRCEGFPVPPEPLLVAMQAMVPTIDQPARKMKRVLRAGRILGNPELASKIVNETRWKRGTWRPPTASVWPDILAQADHRDIEQWAGFWCHFAATMRAVPLGDANVTDIPLEEVLTLLAIQNIAIKQATSDRTASN